MDATLPRDFAHAREPEPCEILGCTTGAGMAQRITGMEECLLWLLWHHQGAKSPVGQPIRRVLGIGEYERMTAAQVQAARNFSDALKLPRATTIIINGRIITETRERLSYADVVTLAGRPVRPWLTVTWAAMLRPTRTDYAIQNGGSLNDGDSIDVCEGMIFNVHNTSGA